MKDILATNSRTNKSSHFFRNESIHVFVQNMSSNTKLDFDVTIVICLVAHHMSCYQALQSEIHYFFSIQAHLFESLHSIVPHPNRYDFASLAPPLYFL